jgi:asparagine synthase (glutamine-hydrolysing)
MLSSCGRYVMVYNGELYNYLELRADLETRGAVFRGNSDSEVLLAAYVEYGEDCLRRFNGMWAFAIWDCERRSLFASRDRFGKKPFYYAELPGRLMFASEIKAILATGQISPTPNPVAVADFCAERVSDHRADTFFQGVRQLPPASCLRWQAGQVTVRPYWILPEDSGEAMTPQQLADIRECLSHAVRLRLRSDTPVGVLLSGGLDSSGIACLAAEFSTAPLHAFSTLDRQPVEEAAGIAQVLAKHGNMVPYRDQPEAACLADELDACLWHQEEPFADGSMLAHFRLMRLASQAGVKVLLTGQGADEVFGGYPGHLQIHLAGLIARRDWRQAWDFWNAVSASGQRLSLPSVLGYALPSALAGPLRRQRCQRGLDWLVEGFDTASPAIAAGYARKAGADALNSALRESITRRTLPGFLHYEDRNSMAFGVETRLPYLDYRLVEKVLPLAGQDKLQGGVTKALLRAALAEAVPTAIVQRTAKQGYPAPLAAWLRHSPPALADTWLALAAACPLLRFERWQRRYQAFMAGRDEELPATWRGLVLAAWHRRFIEQQRWA